MSTPQGCEQLTVYFEILFFDFQNFKTTVLRAPETFLGAVKRFWKLMSKKMIFSKTYFFGIPPPPPTSKMLPAVRFQKKSTRDGFQASCSPRTIPIMLGIDFLASTRAIPFI